MPSSRRALEMAGWLAALWIAGVLVDDYVRPVRALGAVMAVVGFVGMLVMLYYAWRRRSDARR